MPDPIHIVNASTLVTDADAAAMTAAVATQVKRDLCPVWSLLAPDVVFAPGKAAPPGRVISIVDTLDDPQALGWHTDDGRDHIYGVVGCKVVLDHGAKALTGPYAVSTILSHEVMEMVVDPFIASWSDTGRGFMVATEVGDPVQSDHYDIGQVTVSNFVTPAWFDPHATTGPFDHQGVVHAPFTLSHGGYWVQLREGRVSQKFGEGFPDWLADAKQHPKTRTSRLDRHRTTK